MFGDQAVRVLDRHAVSGKWHHAGAKRHMQIK